MLANGLATYYLVNLALILAYTPIGLLKIKLVISERQRKVLGLFKSKEKTEVGI